MAIQKKKAAKVAKKSPISAKPAVKKKATVSPKETGKSKPVDKKLSSKSIVVAKAIIRKKATAKKNVAKKTAKPISKSAPAKKSAKPGVKKAAPKKLSNIKKSVAKKPEIQTKKAATNTKPVAGKKTPSIQKKETANLKVNEQKHAEKSPKAPVVNINDHQKELKKALKKAKDIEGTKRTEKPFVMPKTNTEKALKYEPQFIKSVLDHAPEESTGPSMRYSDGELNEFRDLISRKLETAKKELGYLQGLITRKDEMGGDDTDNRYMTMEDGSLSMEREQLSQMASRQITFIDHLEKAMMRIENKTYGICRVTGKLIDKARLRAVPHATLSIEAKMGIAK